LEEQGAQVERTSLFKREQWTTITIIKSGGSLKKKRKKRGGSVPSSHGKQGRQEGGKIKNSGICANSDGNEKKATLWKVSPRPGVTRRDREKGERFLPEERRNMKRREIESRALLPEQGKGGETRTRP